MAICPFKLGDFNIVELLMGQAVKNDVLLFTLEQIKDGQIEISSENSTDITDKNGNVVRTIYSSKSGTFTSTNAWLHPQIMNASSGSDIEVASASNKLEMPRFKVCEAGKTVDVSDAKDGTIKIIGVYGNGANSAAMTDTEIAASVIGGEFTAPANDDGCNPIKYLVSYKRDKESGIKLSNTANKFPDIYELTFLASYTSPCNDELKPCYIVLPRFMPDPSITISLSKENQEMEFKGNLNIDYCSVSKALYYIYFPDESIVIPGEYVGDPVNVPTSGE